MKMNPMDVCVELLVILTGIGLVLICPYTKVEESFNLQAAHDILYHGRDIDKYDHNEFPGVVPRSFIGPLYLSLLSYPFMTLIHWITTNKFYTQYIVRIALALTVNVAFICYRRAINVRLGKVVGRLLCLVTLSQFHFLFYSSRTLPNTFALALALLAVSAWLRQYHGVFIWLSGAAIVIFRFELSIFFGIILIMELVSGRLKFSSFLYHLIPAGIVCLGLTILIDSYYWRRWLWPEGEVLWYNTILNKSSNWGTSPIWWYFTSALPHSLSLSVLFIPLGLYCDRRLFRLLLPAIGFVCVYSLLPHKELRFIIYIIPLMNTIAASGWAYIWKNKSKLSFVPYVAAHSLMAVSWLMSIVFLFFSYHNYPGGVAFKHLHDMASSQEPVSVHIGVEAAMTGVSRFGEVNPLWIYSKAEGLTVEELNEFDYLIISTCDYERHFNTTHDIIHNEAIVKISRDPILVFPPFKLHRHNQISIIKKI